MHQPMRGVRESKYLYTHYVDRGKGYLIRWKKIGDEGFESVRGECMSVKV